MMAENHSITFGSEEINFTVEYSSRKTLDISVHPDLSVEVKAPLNIKPEIVQQKVKKRAYWIIKQKLELLTFLPSLPEMQYISGESHWYLGRQYRLKVIEGNVSQVKLKCGYIFVETTDKNNKEKIKALLDIWYRKHAVVKFKEKLKLCYEILRKYEIVLPELKIQKMQKRWGSCTKSGKILLNIELIKAPSHCIEYVIMHELCHLKYHDHSKYFYSFLSQVMPDWEKRKKRLEDISINIIN